MTEHNLKTSEGGRGYIADYFKTQLKRHDFTRYIQERLAADFACVLSQHLESVDVEHKRVLVERQCQIDRLKMPNVRREARLANEAEAVKLQRLLMADYRDCRPKGDGLMGWAAAALQGAGETDTNPAAASELQPDYQKADELARKFKASLETTFSQPAINYGVLSDYADKHRLHFNGLCNVVRKAIGIDPLPGIKEVQP